MRDILARNRFKPSELTTFPCCSPGKKRRVRDLHFGYGVEFMFCATAAALAMAASFWVAPSSAMIVDTYTVNASHTNLFDPPITGTLTVDLTTDRVKAASITTGVGSFTLITGQNTWAAGNDYVVDPSNGAGTILALVLDTGSTLFSGKTTTIDSHSKFFRNILWSHSLFHVR